MSDIVVRTEWFTENGDNLIAKIARVSNQKNENNMETAPKLIKYLLKHGHVSPLEMANMCLYIEAPRDVTRQILRHKSFAYQELSQRYTKVYDTPYLRQARLQDTKNRQNSIEAPQDVSVGLFDIAQKAVWEEAWKQYEFALSLGVAKEVARALLPEGMTMSRMYMNGTLRSWVHYIKLREANGTQKEHIEVALKCKEQFKLNFPNTYVAAFEESD
jgi:thymidylate synthase (FAD)